MKTSIIIFVFLSLLGSRFPDIGHVEISSTIVEENDSLTIATRKQYFLTHTEFGTLTMAREGTHTRAKVPRGRNGQDRSGITLPVGIDLAKGFSAPRHRLAIVQELGAVGALKEWIMEAPATSGAVARAWLDAHESPSFNSSEIRKLYLFGYKFFLQRARNRLIGNAPPIAAVAETYRLTEEQFRELAINDGSAEGDYLYELLADLAWNSNQFARGRQNDIAKALNITIAERLAASPFVGDLTKFDKQILRLKALRVIIEDGTIPTSRYGRIDRLAWIDAKVETLERMKRRNGH